MSLFVAVTLVPVLCALLLRLPPPAEERTGIAGTAVHVRASGRSTGMDEGYRRMLHRSLHASADGAGRQRRRCSSPPC